MRIVYTAAFLLGMYLSYYKRNYLANASGLQQIKAIKEEKWRTRMNAIRSNADT